MQHQTTSVFVALPRLGPNPSDPQLWRGARLIYRHHQPSQAAPHPAQCGCFLSMQPVRYESLASRRYPSLSPLGLVSRLSTYEHVDNQLEATMNTHSIRGHLVLHAAKAAAKGRMDRPFVCIELVKWLCLLIFGIWI